MPDTRWQQPDLAETPFDLRLLDWLRGHPGQSAHQIAVSLGITAKHDRGTAVVVEQALKRLKMRNLVRDEARMSRTAGRAIRHWSATA